MGLFKALIKISREDWARMKQLFRILRVSFFFAILICLHVSVSARSQDKVTLSIKNGRLETALQEIRKQTGYFYAFLDEWKDKTKPIYISVTNASVEEALNICFKGQPFTYSIIGKTIVIKEKEIHAVFQSSDLALPDIRGQVLDDKQEPLEKASVEIKGEKRGTYTDANGTFELKHVAENTSLIISFSGYMAKEVQVQNRTFLKIALSQNTSSLDQVQVIAYGTTTQRVSTGNVSTVKAEDIEKQPVNNLLLALEGRVPGMFITQVTGLPGTGITFQIRGQNSISKGNDPLFVVDGVPYSSENLFQINGSNFLGYGNVTAGSPLNNLNPLDIESISVLKDADATSIYGSRGANGVVLITTKKGKSGQTKIDINMQTGLGKVAAKMKLLNTRQYLDMRYEAFKNDGAVPNPNADYDLTLWDTTRNTDWQKELIGGTAQYSDIEAAVSGGNDYTQYLISSNYHKETTVFPGNFYDKKGSTHFTINSSSLNKKFKISFSGIYTVDDNQTSGIDFTHMAIQLAPDAPALYNTDGSLNWAPNAAGVSTWPTGYYPGSSLVLNYDIKAQNLLGSALLSYGICRGLQISSSFGYSNLGSNILDAIPLTVEDPATWSSTQRTTLFANTNIKSWIIEPQLTYAKKILKGELSALLGTTIQQNTSNGQSILAKGFNSDLVMQDIQSATSLTVSSYSNSVYKYNALFGRINYNWQEKYLLNLTARRDGSSRFGPASQFHNFWAAGAGWIFSAEPIIQKNLSVLSYGKLRGSYGTTGSDQVGDYTFLDLYSTVPNIGVPYLGVNGIAPNSLSNPNLAWEETRKFETGLELGFLKDRITLITSYYRNRSSNQLLAYTLPAITGFTDVSKNLAAVVQNQGYEFELKTVNIKSKNVSWTSGFNLSLNQNKLVSGANGLDAFYEEKIGHPLSSVLLFHFVGVDPIKGANQFSDNSGKPISDPNPSTDLTSLINFAPKLYGGFQNSLSYKNLQLDFLFQFVEQPQAPVYLYNYIAGSFSSSIGSNQPVTVLARWRKPGDVTNVERFSQNFSLLNSNANARSSDLNYGDASYIRLKNLSLSYQIPGAWAQKAHLQSVRIYVHAQNLLTITKYKGLDPETQSSISLPPLRVVTAGVQLIL